MKVKLLPLLLAVIICFVAFAPVALAATDYCQRLVNGNQCGKTLYWYYTGRSISYDASHKYGGFLGIGQQTCNYEYYYKYYDYKCSSGHVAKTSTSRIETGHDCGKIVNLVGMVAHYLRQKRSFKRNAKEFCSTRLTKVPWHFFAPNTITV